MQLDTLTLENFSPRLQEAFAVGGPESSLEFVLTEINPLGQSLNRLAFSLTFAGPLQPILPQAIYRLENPAMGELEMFLVPLGPKNGACLYEAVFT